MKNRMINRREMLKGAFEISKKPVLITHSNCRALVPGHPRLKTDEVIKKVGDTNSVIGITGVRMFVKGDEPTTVEHVLDHFDHVRKLIGPEHLGVGSDMDLYGYDAMRPSSIGNCGRVTKGVIASAPMQGKGFVNFRLNTQGKADVINIENLSEFTRVPEPAKKALTSIKE